MYYFLYIIFHNSDFFLRILETTKILDFFLSIVSLYK